VKIKGSRFLKAVCESVSVRGIARVLKISANTVLVQIVRAAKNIPKPAVVMNQQVVEVDELRTYIGKKDIQYWIAYALNRITGQVIDFVIGKRTKQTLARLVDTLLFGSVSKYLVL
jgi:insertion element IS1 protein InsB